MPRNRSFAAQKPKARWIFRRELLTSYTKNPYQISIKWPYKKPYGYRSIPINTILWGMNIHKSQLFWCSPGVQGFDPSPIHVQTWHATDLIKELLGNSCGWCVMPSGFWVQGCRWLWRDTPRTPQGRRWIFEMVLALTTYQKKPMFDCESALSTLKLTYFGVCPIFRHTTYGSFLLLSETFHSIPGVDQTSNFSYLEHEINQRNGDLLTRLNLSLVSKSPFRWLSHL